MKSRLRTLKSIYKWILDILFPENCVGCKQKNTILCNSCIKNIKTTSRSPYEDVYTCFDYHDTVMKKIIWNLKYYRKSNIGEILGKIMHDKFSVEIFKIKSQNESDVIYVIPVPMSKSRQKERGYNQAEKIARGFCAKENMFEIRNDIIIKTVNTAPQARLRNKSKRIKNIKGAFQIKNKELVKGKVAIIIDDVTTTGGTIMEIKRLLLKSGCKKVFGFTVAH